MEVNRYSRTQGKMTHFGTKHVHSEDIQGLATNVLCAHVDDTFQAKPCTYSGSCDTVLTSTSLGDNALLA
jgi:hypothetical protein